MLPWKSIVTMRNLSLWGKYHYGIFPNLWDDASSFMFLVNLNPVWVSVWINIWNMNYYYYYFYYYYYYSWISGTDGAELRVQQNAEYNMFSFSENLSIITSISIIIIIIGESNVLLLKSNDGQNYENKTRVVIIKLFPLNVSK